MICLSIVCGVYLVYYLTVMCKNITEQGLIYSGSILFLYFSCWWAFCPFTWSRSALLMVFLGAILILTGISVECSEDTNLAANHEAIIALVAICILVIQTGLFDFIVWNGFV